MEWNPSSVELIGKNPITLTVCNFSFSGFGVSLSDDSQMSCVTTLDHSALRITGAINDTNHVWKVLHDQDQPQYTATIKNSLLSHYFLSQFIFFLACLPTVEVSKWYVIAKSEKLFQTFLIEDKLVSCFGLLASKNNIGGLQILINYFTLN